VVALGWLVLLALALVLLDVWLGPAQSYLVLLVGVAPWLLFAAWPVAALALVTRHWPLGVAGLVVVALQLAVLLPSFAPWHSPPRPVTASTVTVYDQNVRYNNVNLTRIGEQIATAQPQVVLLEELSARNLPSLEATGVLARYPYSYVKPAVDSRGFGLWSTVPLTGAAAWRTGRLEQVRATLTLPDGTAATLLVVHTDSPTSAPDDSEWNREMTAIAATVRATPGPVLVVGDFNATLAMRQMRRVLGAGLRDGAAMDGAGWRMTWPNGISVLPQVMRLDHVLVSSALTVGSYRVGHADGSDHSPLLFSLSRRA
jgi:endonuclease/exonuclease/phosphatase (EEP) superfamily protein YafD